MTILKRKRGCRALAPLLALAALACGNGGDSGGGGGGEAGGLADQIARGKHYYENVCTACHNGDPNVDGTLGPALAGTPLDVLEAKVMRGEYPEGYTPKRSTSTMARFPYLEPELENIAAYLQSVERET